MRADRLLATAALLFAAGAPASAGAFCQSTTDADGCTTCDPGCTNTAIFWPTECAGYSIHEAGSEDLPFGDLQAAVAWSFGHWEKVVCADGWAPYLRFVETEAATCTQVAYRHDAGNVNLVIWRESNWSYDAFHDRAAIALTTVFFDVQTAHILSANVELNGEFFTFTTSDVSVQADVENTMTHEAGHFLGLAHTTNRAATMFSESMLGETSKRTLEQDDIDAVCWVYPSFFAPGVCNSEPAGGLDLACRPTGCGCSTASPADFAVGTLALLALAFLRRRRGASRKGA